MILQQHHLKLKKQIKGEYDQLNNKDGSWIYYWPNGKIMKNGRYSKNNKNGEWNYYFENGILQHVLFRGI